MSRFVGAQHEFHDAAFVQGWADRFVPTPPRMALFDLILERVSALGLPNAHIVEPGLGPGYMARHILERNPVLSYAGLDFSEELFDVARTTIGGYMRRVTNQSGPDGPGLATLPVATTRSYRHNLDSARSWRTAGDRGRVLARLRSLAGGGILMNGDFIKPEGTSWTYEPGRFEVGRHLELLRRAGFKEPAFLAMSEHNLDHPTAARNHACLIAVK